ncbi:hypothetical protein RB7937 [Rhodopirellula baltica SH 1]|uniref:Uncharacterized protein n=1 Tax=Rhodopirellula baltica (strain DSM 10527 / NCIMB 13988 / SH1) TaxID=243090 RepID=Q7UMW6_RHOBA|nr:hypothetical protein RB7937 [Rhodopirellula baltica SH 1]
MCDERWLRRLSFSIKSAFTFKENWPLSSRGCRCLPKIDRSN